MKTLYNPEQEEFINQIDEENKYPDEQEFLDSQKRMERRK